MTDDEDALATPSMSNGIGPVSLSEAIGGLRRELAEALMRAQDEEIRFEVGDVSIELSVAVERELAGAGGVKFWVVNAEASASSTRSATQTLTVSLTPRTSDGKPLLTRRG